MANFLTSAGTICSSKLSNRPDGLICAPTSSNTAKFSIPTELNGLSILLPLLSSIDSSDSGIKLQSLLQG
jgi:hypothetical protein